MPNTYDRQANIGLRRVFSPVVVGVGGIGSWVAIDLALAGVGSLYLYDPDVLEESNRNRLPFCQSSLHRPKVEVVADYVRAIRPGIIAVDIQGKLEGMLLDLQLPITDAIIECTDSPISQKLLYNLCKSKDKVFIRAGYNYDTIKRDFHITVTSTVSGWVRVDAEAERETYTVEPSYVVPAQVAASLAVEKLLRQPDLEVSCYLGEIGVTVLKKQSRLTARCQPNRRR